MTPAPGPEAEPPTSGRRPALLLAAAVVLFLVAVRTLGASVDLIAPVLRDAVGGFLAEPAAVLGVGWLAAYVLLNGSVVAALAVTLFASGVLATGGVYLMVAGSRLGAAAFVVLVGLLDYLQRGRRQRLRDALGLGLMAFLVAHTIYLPAAGLELLTPWEPGRRLAEAIGSLAVTVPRPGLLRPAVHRLGSSVGAPVLIAASLALLLGAIRLADRGARALDRERLQSRWLARLDRRAVSFGAGLALTAVTASVAFSVGVVVPLYNRGWVSRSQVLPYLLGANLATLIDTVLVGLALDSPVGTAVVLSLTAVVAALTGLAFAFYDGYVRLVERSLEAVTSSRPAFALFAASLVLVPLLLVLLPVV